MSKWETGQGLPDIALLPALAAALGITVDELLAGETAPLSPAEEPMDDTGEPAPAEFLPPTDGEPGFGEPLADLPRMQPTRQEWAAVVLSCRKLPGQRLERLVLALVVPNAACTQSADALQRHLHQLVPAVCRFGTARTPRLHRPAKAAGLAVVGVALFAFALAPALGVAGTISPTGTVLMLSRDPETGTVTDLHSGQTFPYPVVGRMKKQWLTGDCCAVTYQTTDGSTHVYLATYGDRGSGYSYYYVAPLLTGTWRQYEDALNPGITLRCPSASPDIQVLSPSAGSDYSQIYSQTVQFGTLGVALCDDEGLPHWTVVLGRDYDASDGVDPYGSLIICPVSMEPTEAVTLHYYSE